MGNSKALDELSRMLEQVRTLPPLPQGVAALLALDQSDPALVEKTKSVIEADPALTAQLLKVSNSAAFTGQEIVDSVERGIMRVGARMIVGSFAETHLQGTFDVSKEPGSGLWNASALAAHLALKLAEAAPSVGLKPETAYTYGLLHDVGRLAMAHALGDALLEIAAEAPALRTELVRRERALFGFDHAVAGRLVGNRWRLPADITLVIAAHHLPTEERARYPASINRVIDLMSLVDEMTHLALTRDLAGAEADATLAAHLALPDVAPLLATIGLDAAAASSAARAAVAAVAAQRKLVAPPAPAPVAAG